MAITKERLEQLIDKNGELFMGKFRSIDDVFNDLRDKSDEYKKIDNISNIVNNLVEGIVEARVNKNWSQRKLAEEAGMKQSAIARIETLDIKPNIITLAKMIDALDLKLVIIKDYDFYEKIKLVWVNDK